MSCSPLAAARALHGALEAGKHGDALRELFTDDVTCVEHPSLINPKGGTKRLDQLLADSTSGAALLSKQTFDVHSAIEHGDTAILRLTWTGVVAREVGPFAKGQVLTAHIAQFVRARDGRVASIETFDCYEPFQRG